jgi:hypothetical protein
MIICTPYMSNYYLCVFFEKLQILQKLEKTGTVDDDVCILHFKKYAISNCSGLGR